MNDTEKTRQVHVHGCGYCSSQAKCMAMHLQEKLPSSYEQLTWKELSFIGKSSKRRKNCPMANEIDRLTSRNENGSDTDGYH